MNHIPEETLKEARAEFSQHQFTVVKGAFPDPESLAKRISGRASASAPVYVPENMRVVAAGGGDLRHTAFDRNECDEFFREVGENYIKFLDLARAITGKSLVPSPYTRSAYYTKIYNAPNDRQGWHHDTNDISVVVYLTSDPDGGGTDIRTPSGIEQIVMPQQGSALIMNGRECWHQALQPTVQKVTILYNYYLLPVRERDPRLDAIIFGS